VKILFLVPYAPSLVRVRSYNLIRALVQRGHTVTLATLWSNAAERANLAELEALGVELLAEPISRARALWNCARNFSRPTPLQSVYAWQPRLLERVVNVLLPNKSDSNHQSRANAAFDVIHIEHLRGARYAEHLKTFLRAMDDPTPVVWDSVDCISLLFEQAAHASSSTWSRFVTGRELTRTRWYEAWLVRQFERVLVTSARDRSAFFDLLNEFAPASGAYFPALERIRVLPNGVRLDYFAPCAIARDCQTIVFTGKMSYHANVTAALYLVHQVMPLVWEKYPNACAQIVGQNPPRELKTLAARFPHRVIVTGTVPDVRPYLAKATLAVAPILYGAGIQNKVLEALAMAAPVVATPCAVAALDVEHEQQLLIADAPEAFAGAIIRLLRNIGLRERLGQNGRAYVNAHHDWMDIAARLEAIYQETALAPLQPV
jgi:glycosyltransferase involved in cell wall biosynthesis